MLTVISPAKTLDYETPAHTSLVSRPLWLAESEQLIARCRELTPAQLASLMKISDKLAGLNAARFAEWHPDFTPENAKQALLAFKGDVYTGLDGASLDDADFEFAQKRLRILSGLYGLLRPLDLIQPYRLEMGTRLDNPRGNNLYAFWGERITDELNRVLAGQAEPVLVNLASNEYFKAIQPARMDGAVVTPVFKDCKNGQYKIISFYAKKARGMMVRYIIDKRLDSPQGLVEFDYGGYRYCATESTERELVFKRG